MSLTRFLVAQQSREDGYAEALAEMRAGQKRGHWIWYVFPQLAGLGTSAASREFAVRDADEAAEYLRHGTLGPRLLEITRAVAEQLHRGASLPVLMASDIDARKLVSSLTLFGEVAHRLAGGASEAADYQTFAALAEEVLAAARRQGYERCAYTLRRLAAPMR